MPKSTSSTHNFAEYVALAEAGNTAAQIYVGWAYLEGRLVSQDLRAGEEWLRKSYKQGSVEGGYRLAMVLVQRSDREGIDLLTHLGDQGYPPANYELGNCLYTGNLVPRDAIEAAKRWGDAEKKGHVIARIKLLKYQSSISPIYKKPLFALKILINLLCAIILFLKNERDERVLGTFS
ncbi:sel1 repeat family protein [Mesorhizobium waimense]|uniref:Sel1 repeat family protein n=1 Tax=Mesorhizobium waimense TaxID=1300307 RepID=A0A3A5JUB4_9HYPH|nr:tetratricopeptide repeat protein [Mesorhizobium waimense]RJT23903.1 sel1 repeat family protein [Mesorhizobium waimense]